MAAPGQYYERGLLHPFVDYDAPPPWLNESVDPMDAEGNVHVSQLPGLGMWRAYQSGIFALGIEPHTAVGPPDQSYSVGHPDFLEAGAARSFSLRFRLG